MSAEYDNEPDSRVAAAVLMACHLDVQVAKPGNVSLESPGHGMRAEHFLRSAEVIAPILAVRGAGVGERVLRAIEVTQAAAGCNTNLGIVLLAAPLCQAVLQPGDGSLMTRTSHVLNSLTVEDSEYTYRAIRRAAPAGLGSVSRWDVALSPDEPLTTIMRESQSRDRIAWQYANDFDDIFGFGLARLRLGCKRWGIGHRAVLALYMGFMSRFPDTHIQRKHGHGVATEVWRKASLLEMKCMNARDDTALIPQLHAFDTELKIRGINPGTSADLTVATLMAADLERITLKAESARDSASPRTGVEGDYTASTDGVPWQ